MPETLDQNRQQTAKEYAKIKRRLFLVELLGGGAYVLLWALTGLAPWWREQVYQLTSLWWLAVPLFAAGFGLPYLILSAPLEYYSGFVLPHRYNQSKQTRGAWLLDQLKGLAIMAVLGLIMLEIIYALLTFTPQTWWLWTGLVMLGFTVLLSNLAPILIFPLFFSYKPLEDDDLAARLTRLAEQAGTRVEGVYVFDMSRKTVAANAALMGLGRTRRIVLGDTLTENFTADEIETVLAHELGHHVNHDIPMGIAVQAVLTLGGLWLAHLLMQAGVAYFGYANLADPATLPLFLLAMSLFGLVSMPLGNLWSRWREVQADAYALHTTGKPHAFISAMTRLANQNLADADPPPWVEFLLHSHPAISKRVAHASHFAQTQA